MTSIAIPAGQSARELDAQIRALVNESFAHRAVHHPYLQAFACGDFPDPLAAVRQYAWEYSGYSAWFPMYLRSVIDRLQRDDHRTLLLHNLEEEKGQLGEDDCEALRGVGIDPATVMGIPHPTLFRRFCYSLGITDAQLAAPSAAAVQWRTRFFQFLQNATEAQAVGALGLGTEQIVRPVYEKLLSGIKRLGILMREQYVFFELHCLVDDQHQQDLLSIARDLAATPEGLRDLRSGMRTALALRCEFWDHMLQASNRTREAHSA